jgi:hypothetical protein
MTDDNKNKNTDAALIDLASLDTVAASDKGARIAILHPINKEPIGIFIQLLGKHSTTFRELIRERINKRVKAESMAAKRGKNLDPRTAEEVEAEALEMLVACTLGWETEIYETTEKPGEKPQKVVKETKPTIFIDGEHLPFNHQNGIKVYTRLLWLREQIDDAIGDLENFMPA